MAEAVEALAEGVFGEGVGLEAELAAVEFVPVVVHCDVRYSDYKPTTDKSSVLNRTHYNYSILGHPLINSGHPLRKQF